MNAIKEALEAAKRWHQGDKWRNSVSNELRNSWQSHMDLLDSAIALLTETKPVEPIGEMREGGVVWFGQNPHAHPIGTKFYTSPQPTRDEIIEECAKVCEQRMHRQFFKLLKHRLAVDACVAAIRALKGNK